MTRIKATIRIGGLLGAMCLLAVAGCTKTFVVDRYPPFYTPQMKTVAVLPFENRSLRPGAASFFTESLADALARNGTYDVVSLTAVDDEDRLPATTQDELETLLADLRREGQVQAVLVGKVLRLSASSYPVAYVEPARPYYPYGWGYGYGYGCGYGYGYGPYYPRVYYETYNRARVAFAAEFIRVRDGQVLYATTDPVWVTVSSSGNPPEYDLEDAMLNAVDTAAEKLVAQVAIVPRKVKVKPGRDFKIARGRRGGQWEFTDKIPADAEEMFVVLRLPVACDRNPFRLVVVRDGRPGIVADAELIWSRTFPASGKGFPFDPGRLAEAGGGPGEYKVHFYSGEKKIMTRKFKITRPKATALRLEPDKDG